jgi:hypothetical protein
MGEASSQPERASSRPGRRAGRPAVLTPPLGIPLLPSRQRRPAAEPPLASQPGLAGKLCSCGHGREAHEHYRKGSDCGICGVAGCAAYARAPLHKRLWSRRS